MLGTPLAWSLRVGFDIKEGVNYTDFTSCLCVCLNVCLCYQGWVMLKIKNKKPGVSNDMIFIALVVRNNLYING